MAHLLRKHELLSAHDLDRIQTLCSPPRSCCRSSIRRASRCSRSDPAPVVAYVPGTDAVYTRPQYAAETSRTVPAAPPAFSTNATDPPIPGPPRNAYRVFMPRLPAHGTLPGCKAILYTETRHAHHAQPRAPRRSPPRVSSGERRHLGGREAPRRHAAGALGDRERSRGHQRRDGAAARSHPQPRQDSP